MERHRRPFALIAIVPGRLFARLPFPSKLNPMTGEGSIWPYLWLGVLYLFALGAFHASIH